MSETHNPPAFPRMGEGFGNPLYDTPGMDLRDYLAAKAMQGIVTLNGNKAMVASEAYALADAMLKARAQGGQS